MTRSGEDATLLARYDALGPVGVEELRGWWRGRELSTEHPLSGILEPLGWWGKWFGGPDDAHPLVFRRRDGGCQELDPVRIPLSLMIPCAPLLRARVAVAGFHAVAPLLRTTRPRGRLRVSTFRGVSTATLVYDHQPILDAFRRVGPDVVMGAMDLRGMATPYLFELTRNPEGCR